MGVKDLHGLIWEWTEDFNSALVSGESRSDSNINQKLFCAAGAQGRLTQVIMPHLCDLALGQVYRPNSPYQT
ncbi:hypothetical protein [Psychrosphaera algicola]|uniref:Uncharacterized protein n=1 Tax=Psychrosphaera algicola TaxID=3023714 RepID=A0ABT5FBQ7_9GAMM|nr:hypothetical protein [Psychrosphaera sp. G1-22]MDC2887990.1 hypothetical protein [Psychrosphaera sp. G1-22]